MDTWPIGVGDVKGYRGDPTEFVLSIEGDDGSVDLLGFGDSFYAQLRYRPDAANVIDFDVDATTGINVVTGALETLAIRLTDSQTAALEAGHPYVWDVEARGGTDSPFTLWFGTHTLDADVTRA